MGLIWQEFKAVIADAWGAIATWSGWMLKGIAALLRDAASNYQRVLVVAIGFPASLLLLGIPFLAMLDNVGFWLGGIFGKSPNTKIFEGSFIGYLLMFCLGLGVFTLTVELDDRLAKRIGAKRKSDQYPAPESED